MSLATIQADVNSALGLTASTTSRVTTVEILQWINQGYRIAQTALAEANINYYQGETEEFDTTDGEDTYSLPTKFLKMKRAEIQYDDDVDKIKMTIRDMNDVGITVDPDNDPWSKTNPFIYYWENDYVVKPVPDEDSADWDTDNGSAIKLWFIELQDDMTTGANVAALPLAYEYILAYPAIAPGLRKLKRFKEASVFDGLWQAGLSKMVRENAYKDKTKPLRFTIRRGVNKSAGIWRP